MYKKHPQFTLKELEDALKEHRNFNSAGKSLGIPGKVFQRQLIKLRGVHKVSTSECKSCKNCHQIFARPEGLKDIEWSRRSSCSTCKASKREASNRADYLRKRVSKLSKQKTDPRRKEYRRKYWKSEHGKAVAKHFKGLRRQRLNKVKDPNVREYILALFSNPNKQCRYCSSTEQLTLEHLTPLSKGGTHTCENIGISCKSCNFSKHNKTEQEYLNYLLQIKENSHG